MVWLLLFFYTIILAPSIFVFTKEEGEGPYIYIAEIHKLIRAHTHKRMGKHARFHTNKVSIYGHRKIWKGDIQTFFYIL